MVGHNHRFLADKNICLDKDLTFLFNLNKQAFLFELLFGKWHCSRGLYKIFVFCRNAGSGLCS